MPDNPNTNKPSELPALDVEDWDLAFAPYKGNTSAALNMGFCLMLIKAYLIRLRLKRFSRASIMRSWLCIPTLNSTMYATRCTSKL